MNGLLISGLLATPATWAAEGDGSGVGVLDPAPAPPVADPPPAEGGGGDKTPEPPAAQAGDGGGVAAQPAKPEPPKPARPAAPDWREARIARLTGQLREAQERAARAERVAAPATPPPAPAVDPALLNAEAERLATQMEAQRSFNARCEATVAAGREAFGAEGFNSAVAGLRAVVDPADAPLLAQYNLLLDAAIETGEGPKIIHSLGSNPNEAARLLALPPVKMALEIAKLAQAKGAELTAAPRPISPIGNRGASNERIDPDDVARADRLDTATWMRRREEQVKARAGA